MSDTVSVVDASPRRRFPERIGRYELLLPIASGGTATVYLGRVHGIGGFEREVAVKVMHPHLYRQGEEPDLAGADLIEEAKLAVRIRHPNVVPVLDVGEDPEGIFLVMDYVEGESLAALLRLSKASTEELPVPIALRILCDAYAGLDAAHELRNARGAELGIVHRDFSPQNILVGIDGVAKLTDFGIAKAADRDSRTRSGMVKGKAGYMSPEQARAQPLDRRSDVWAAGVVAWEVLAGRRLFEHSDPVAIALAIVTQRAPRIRSVVAEVPADADEAIAMALTRDRDQRLATVAELGRRLAAAWGTELASRAEVAECVTRLAGDRIAARRARAQEILEQRSATASSWAADAHATEPVAPAEDARAVTPRRRPAALTLALGALIAGGLVFAAVQRDPPEPDAAEPAQGEELDAPARSADVVDSVASAQALPSASAAVTNAGTVTLRQPPAPRTRVAPASATSATPLGPNPYEVP